jgi:hypothetical protein
MAERISSQTTVQRNAGKRVRNENSTVAKPSDPNQESGTSPMPDFVVENHGSIFLLQPWRRSARCALLGSSLALLGTSCFLVLALVAQ